MFDNEYSFRGIHAIKVNKLTGQYGDNNNFKIFKRNIDVYMIAPIVGFLYQRKKKVDEEGNETAKIMGDRIIKSKEDLKYTLRLIILLDEDYEDDEEKRIDLAFRHLGSEKTKKENIELFENYVRGGIDVLYEKIIEPSDNYIENLYDFLEEFNERFIENKNKNDIYDLIELARS